MNLNFLSCRKYRKLYYLDRDGVATPRQQSFLAKHESTCSTCEREMSVSMAALDMLRSSVMEAEPKANFDDRLIRKIRVDSVRNSFRYWSPAVLGAAVASLVVLAALQMIAQPNRLPTVNLPGGEARRLAMPAFPDTVENTSLHIISQ